MRRARRARDRDLHLMRTTPFALPVALALTLAFAGCAVQVPARTVVVAEPPPRLPPPPPRPPGDQHPAYLHALEDLRAARWLIVHRPGDARVTADEDVALARIDETIDDIRRAAFNDGKDLDDHPRPDQTTIPTGRLHQADDLLRKARADIAREEDNGAVRGLRDRAVHRLDEAIRATDRAIHDALDGR